MISEILLLINSNMNRIGRSLVKLKCADDHFYVYRRILFSVVCLSSVSCQVRGKVIDKTGGNKKLQRSSGKDTGTEPDQ